MKLSTIVSLLALAASAVTASPLVKRLPQGFHPPFSTPKSLLDAGLTCQNGSPSSQSKPILLVPGTGATGKQSFDSNWIPLSAHLGYNPCWISPPPFMLNDSQINAEYIVNAVNILYAGSRSKKVPVLTWSQGGLAAQWALTFFPSIRSKVDRLMAFAPDYKGTIEAGLLNAVGLSPQSVWQQTAGSAFVTALQNAGGLNQIVPTTNLYSATDEIVQPQITNSPLDSSHLFNAKNIQAQSVCGPLFIIDHAGSLTSQFSYVVGKSALASPTGQAQSKDYGSSDCNPLPADPLSPQDKKEASALLLVAGANLVAGPKQNCEPDLKPYARRFAIGKRTCSGFVTRF
ncbi:probable Lipase B precursor [Ustilago bromivora]|uniref:Probable Lipase B n=1 Tax=Ustilago bromivora TaxID=307758 RepID=A0A1K0H9H8_9BASI|nr:probable Lipase B precursor [Ustilago bromivora]SYW84041.1 probable Lipase B precursor [Ustilago bromivora]